MTAQVTDTTPWYKQFWPWFVLAIPATAVVLGITLLIVATQNRVSIVQDDWYKEGLAINQRLDKQHAANDLGVRATIRFDKALGRFKVTTGNLDPQVYTGLKLNLIHPTLEGRDKFLELSITPSGDYIAQSNIIPTGFYYVQLSDLNNVWQLDGTINFSNEVVVTEFNPE